MDLSARDIFLVSRGNVQSTVSNPTLIKISAFLSNIKDGNVTEQMRICDNDDDEYIENYACAYYYFAFKELVQMT